VFLCFRVLRRLQMKDQLLIYQLLRDFAWQGRRVEWRLRYFVPCIQPLRRISILPFPSNACSVPAKNIFVSSAYSRPCEAPARPQGQRLGSRDGGCKNASYKRGLRYTPQSSLSAQRDGTPGWTTTPVDLRNRWKKGAEKARERQSDRR
jgi:hypothetical protein